MIVGRIVFVLERNGTRLRAVNLEEHVGADAVDKRSKTLRGRQSFALPEGNQHAHKGFLLRVFDEGGRPQPRPQLQRQQIAEVLREMPFRVWMPGNQALHIRAIEIAPGQRCHSCQFYPTLTGDVGPRNVTKRTTCNGVSRSASEPSVNCSAAEVTQVANELARWCETNIVQLEARTTRPSERQRADPPRMEYWELDIGSIYS
jgi:hypothetical protein